MHGFKTIPEAARQHIDTALAQGISVAELRADEKKFQDDIVRLKQTNEAALDASEVVFLDRGMHDTIAYNRANGDKTDDWIMAIVGNAHYAGVFLLAPLPHYQQDYARTEDADFAVRLHGLLRTAYQEAGMEPVDVPVMSVAERADFILQTIEGEL